MGLLVLAACSGPPRGDSGEFAVVPIVFDGKALGAEATLRYDAGRLEFMGVSSDNPDVLVAAHASLDSVAEGSVAEGSVSVALATVAEPVQGRLAQASFRVKAPGGEVTLTDLRVIDAARGEVAPGTEAAPALLNVNPAAGYDLAARASALDAHLRAQAVSSQPVLDASFADFPLGDLDRSGRVTLEDVVAIAAIAKGKDASPTDYQLYHSDLNGNGVVNSSDVAAALFKVVDRKLEAELQVAPRVLNLDLGDSGLILLGNAGNRPLPDVTVTSPPGVSVSEISHEGAVGRVFQAEASAVTASGAIVFDAGLAGTQVVALNAAFDPALCEAYEPNDAREEAAPIEPGTILAAICPEFDVDWYSLTLETSQLLSLELGIPTGSSLNQVYGTLYDAQGNPVGSVSIFDDPFGGGYGQTFAMYVPAGSYTLELSGFSFFGGDPLSAVYSLDFSAEEPSVPAI
ncbi:MAG: dockerin type I repeat-containing protein, partial [Deinococcota bacterium]|nr:dockerin type I repeat-containing protein [Deinococcota bacterium]